MEELTYEKAGVNRVEADLFVEKIKSLTQKARNKNVKSSVGGYASLYALNKKTFLAAATDGVGTKLKLAFQMGRHDTVGIDLVAMSVNDLICVGAQPLFFLDYLATSSLDSRVAYDVLKGVVEGCRVSECALVGGETAEMPGFYQKGEYDLAGFAVGMVDSTKVLPSARVKPGDKLIGLASSGFHSNGYSLIRKWLEQEVVSPEFMEKLLEPTKIYVSDVLPLIEKKKIKGLAHITGSGILNLPRVSEKVSYEFHYPEMEALPEVFHWAARKMSSFKELAQTFNMGVGMVLVVDSKDEKVVVSHLARRKLKSWVLGEVVKKRKGKGSEIFVRGPSGESFELDG